MGELNRPGGGRYERGTEEFSRVINFNDAVFAIALTLLSVSLAVPVLEHGSSSSELWNKLGDNDSQFISFVISFIVIGRYWFAHHQFILRLGAVDNKLIGLGMVYLLFVAFLPFPTEMLGAHFDNPAALIVYAANVALISGFEVMMFSSAYRTKLFQRQMPAAVFRYGRLMSSVPVFTFVLSMPVAYVSTTAACLMWFLGIPIGIWADRHAPQAAAEFL